MNSSRLLSDTSVAPLVGTRREVGDSKLNRLLVPSFSDALFLAVLIWLFATGPGGWVGLLADGDSGWHIRTGEWILQNGRVPTVDLFSFSKPDQPWFAWEWLTDILYAKVHGAAGLKGLVLLSGLMIAAFGTLLFRQMISRGTTPFAALLLSLIVLGASSVHFLARPHIFTLLALTLSLWLIDNDRRAPSWHVWLLVPLTALWVNMHGGFLAIIACLGLLVAGTAATEMVSYWAEGKRQDWRGVLRYCSLFIACSCASLANPYGTKLHSHIFDYLNSDWIRNNVQEFQSPVFRSETMLQFELMLFLALITVGWLLIRREFVGAFWILFWGHSALASARHVPLFMIVSAPWVAEGATLLWKRYLEAAPKTSIRGIFASLGRDMTGACRWTSVWVAAVALGFVVAQEPLVRWPKDYPEQKFPTRMVAKFAEKLATGRVLTMDQWADYLIYRQYPRQRVFVDGRSDFFGKEIGDQYVNMIQGHWNWESLLERNRFDMVLSPVEWPLASLLKASKAWRSVEDDGQSILFERIEKPAAQRPVLPMAGDHVDAKRPHVRLMKTPDPAELRSWRATT